MNDKIKGILTLYEGVLNDDTLTLLKDGWHYRGHNNAVVKIEYYTFRNAWENDKHTRFFKTLENALKWYKKEMLDRVIEQGGYWLAESPQDEPDKIEDILREKLNNREELTTYEKSLCIDEWDANTLYADI